MDNFKLKRPDGTEYPKGKMVKLKDICNIFTGKLNANAMEENGMYPFFTCSRDIYTINSYSFDGEAILIAGNGELGLTKYYNGKFDAYQRTYVLINFKKDINVKYVLNEINSKLPKKIKKESIGGAMPYILLETIASLEIYLPSLEEQNAIVEILEPIEKQIEDEKKIIEQEKEFKKAMLQRMFPEKGKKVPEVRFPEFTEDWEQRKLGDVAEFNPKSELPEVFEYVDLESVVGTEMVSHRTETKLTAPSRAQRLARYGDVFYQTVRPYQKNNYLFEKPDKNYVFSTGYAQMRPSIDTKFLMSFLQTDNFVKVVLENCTGTSYPAINSTDLSNLEITLPHSEEEQSRIGQCIFGLDNLITLHQRKLEKLEKLKKGLMQTLFS